MSPLAHRALHLTTPSFSYVASHPLWQSDPFDSASNPEGYINFGAAEHHLLWDKLHPTLSAARAVAQKDAHYGPMYGGARLRRLLTGLLQQQAKCTLDPENLVVAGGASAVIDMLAWVLFNPGEGVLLSAPYYAGFGFDLLARAGVNILPVPSDEARNFLPDARQLQAVYDDAEARGVRVRGLLLNNPHNPSGAVYTRAQLRPLLAFAEARGVEVIVDEIYAHGVYGTNPFESCLCERAANIHTVYGLAKDFGLSGFKVGMAYSRNPSVVQAMRTLAYLCPVSTDTQAVVCTLLEDAATLADTLATSRSRLEQAAAVTARAIGRMGGRVFPGHAGLFAWIDLRAFLQAPSFAAESALHAHFLAKARVNLNPGQVFANATPGWFRLCFATPAPVLAEGLSRMGRAVAQAA